MGTSVGLFGAIGRETKGAIRSFNYDVHHSKRFRQLGVLAVAAVAGGVMATGLLVRSPAPELIGMEADQEGSDVTDGWSGNGADTQGQDAEAAPEASGTVPAPTEAAAAATSGAPSTEAGRTDTQAGAPGAVPGLTPIEKPGGPVAEESDTATTAAPEPDPEPSEAPTTAGPSPSGTPTEQPTPTKTPSASPTPTKTPTE